MSHYAGFHQGDDAGCNRRCLGPDAVMFGEPHRGLDARGLRDESGHASRRSLQGCNSQRLVARGADKQAAVLESLFGKMPLPGSAWPEPIPRTCEEAAAGP